MTRCCGHHYNAILITARLTVTRGQGLRADGMDAGFFIGVAQSGEAGV
jgi:hypothetical protein